MPCATGLTAPSRLTAPRGRLAAFLRGFVYAPWLNSIDDIRTVASSVDRPLNVLAGPDVPPVAGLAAAGVARTSVGSAFANVSWAGLAAAAELLDLGTYGSPPHAVEWSRAVRAAFTAQRGGVGLSPAPHHRHAHWSKVSITFYESPWI